MPASFKRFWMAMSGATAIEYAMIAGGGSGRRDRGRHNYARHHPRQCLETAFWRPAVGATRLQGPRAAARLEFRLSCASDLGLSSLGLGRLGRPPRRTDDLRPAALAGMHVILDFGWWPGRRNAFEDQSSGADRAGHDQGWQLRSRKLLPGHPAPPHPTPNVTVF